MRKALILFDAVLLALVLRASVNVYRAYQSPTEVRVSWQGSTPSCPAGYNLVADQAEAMAGRDSAHCVR